MRVAQAGRVHSAKHIEARGLGVCIMNINIYLCSRSGSNMIAVSLIMEFSRQSGFPQSSD